MLASSSSPPSSSPSRLSVLSRVPTEIWELILFHCVHVPSPSGYLIHPPSQYTPMLLGRGSFTLSPFEPPHMHWDGLRSPISCAYMHKLAAVHTRRRLGQVSRGFRELAERLSVWRSQVEWLCLPMDMDSRLAIIRLAEERSFGHVGRLVKRLEFSSGAEETGIPNSWSRRPDEGLMRRIVAHCAELEEVWCGIEVPSLAIAVVKACPKTLRVFSCTGQLFTTGEVYSLLAHCPALEVLRFTYLIAPVPSAEDDSSFLPYGMLPPLSLRTLSLCLMESVDPLLGWMSTLHMPHLKYLKIERDYRRGTQPGADGGANDQAAGWAPIVASPAALLPPNYMQAWQPPLSNPTGPPTFTAIAEPEPPLPLGVSAFIHAHGQRLTTLEVLEPFDPLLLLPSLGWALLDHCPNVTSFVTSLPGSAYGIATRPRHHANLKWVGCYGFWLENKRPGDEEEGRRTRVHLENVLDAVITLIGGDLPSLEYVRFFDVQRAKVGGSTSPDSSRATGTTQLKSNTPIVVTNIVSESTSPLGAVPVHPPFPSSPLRYLGGQDPWVEEDDSERVRPEYARTLRTIRELCVANGVRFEDAQGELVDCWAGRREMWHGSRGLV
ncbi:hypothetical protein CALVIDRAFT_538530 [Calocera viscosa TUFC12733]|uniref:F-box domain-containing protein n=1 Tax=Calocera viscosa (strain TUFC12733) TaxID=1330018 RepID=A0A167KVX2_CALVF|nr:hypothetical protein CALVIDRAFT_538530 [Calocera viscosa TUFC12733]